MVTSSHAGCVVVGIIMLILGLVWALVAVANVILLIKVDSGATCESIATRGKHAWNKRLSLPPCMHTASPHCLFCERDEQLGQQLQLCFLSHCKYNFLECLSVKFWFWVRCIIFKTVMTC